jgi:hypothetical protein
MPNNMSGFAIACDFPTHRMQPTFVYGVQAFRFTTSSRAQALESGRGYRSPEGEERRRPCRCVNASDAISSVKRNSEPLHLVLGLMETLPSPSLVPQASDFKASKLLFEQSLRAPLPTRGHFRLCCRTSMAAHALVTDVQCSLARSSESQTHRVHRCFSAGHRLQKRLKSCKLRQLIRIIASQGS